ERIPVPSLYLARERPVVERDGALIMVDDERLPLRDGERPVLRKVRFRTLGCYPLTGAIASEADTLEKVIAEMLAATTSERRATGPARASERALMGSTTRARWPGGHGSEGAASRSPPAAAASAPRAGATSPAAAGGMGTTRATCPPASPRPRRRWWWWMRASV